MADNYTRNSQSVAQSYGLGGQDTNPQQQNNPPIPPRAPLEPIGVTELPLAEPPQMSPTGGLPSSASNTQPTSPTQSMYPDPTLGADRQSRATSGQYVPSSLYSAPAPGYMDPNPNVNSYGYSGHNSYFGAYGAEPKMEYGPGGVAVGGVGYASPVQQPSGTQPIPPAGAQQNTPQPEPVRICGLRKSTFWLAFTILLLVIIGALVGGILGGVIMKNKTNDSSQSADSSPPPRPPQSSSTTRTTSTTTSSTTTSSSTTQTWLFPLHTGTWTLNGERSLQQGTCIGGNSNSSSSVALWNCTQYETYQVQVDADSTYGYLLNGDQPTRFRAVTPTPPSSNARYWEFTISYEQVPTAVPVQGNCVMKVTMAFLLGEDATTEKDNYSWVELAKARSDCMLQNGLRHSSSLSCGCGYLATGLFKRDLPMSPAKELLEPRIIDS